MFRALGVLLACSLAAQRRDELRNPVDGSPEAIEAGRKLYVNSCSGCHGANAEGGRGPRLHSSRFVRNAGDERLFDSLKSGIKGSDMPATPLPDDQIWRILAFVRSLNASAYETPVAGDAAAGGQLFESAGCRNCHQIAGKGGVLGPDLTNLGLTRSVASIRESILKPNERWTEGHRGVTVIFRDGGKLEGVARNNTNYALQVLDARGALHHVDKAQVEELAWSRKSLMPEDYQTRLGRQGLNDLIAFLSRQAGRAPAPKEEGR